MQDLITVIVPIYQVEKYLKKCLDSILNQTYKNLEFLIINDGTKNGEKQLIESYNDNRIRIIDNEKNMGLEKSLNKGIENAKG